MPDSGERYRGASMMIHQKTSTSAGLAIASALFLTACQPQTPAASTPAAPAQTAEAPASAEGCAATVEKAWGGTDGLVVKGWTSGATCKSAIVTLGIYGKDGLPIYAWASATQFIFGLQNASTADEMKAALQEWNGPDNLPPDMTGTLPPWNETSGQPDQAEFFFIPQEGMEEVTYDDLRKQNLPMLCYPQGQESTLCLVAYPGAPAMIEEIGIQTFPG